MADIDNVFRDLAAQNKQRDAALNTAAAAAPGGALDLLLTYRRGTRVLDLITGEQGVIVNGKRESVTTQPA